MEKRRNDQTSQNTEPTDSFSEYLFKKRVINVDKANKTNSAMRHNST